MNDISSIDSTTTSVIQSSIKDVKGHRIEKDWEIIGLFLNNVNAIDEIIISYLSTIPRFPYDEGLLKCAKDFLIVSNWTHRKDLLLVSHLLLFKLIKITQNTRVSYLLIIM